MVDVAGTRVVAILTRAPSAGGKTRLFADLGIAPDSRLLDALLLDTVDGAAEAGFPIVLVVTPPQTCAEVGALVEQSTGRAVAVVPQSEGDLGARMRDAMASLLDRGATAVALIGSDLPHITGAIINDAFARLDEDRDAIVLGPATDGGYYLVAATRVPDVFDAIEWSTPRVLEQTVSAARARGLAVEFTAELDDIDRAESLRRLCSLELKNASRTRRLLSLLKRG